MASQTRGDASLPAISEVETGVNLRIEEDRVVTSNEARVVPEKVEVAAQEIDTEIDWNIRQLALRPQQIGSFLWKTGEKPRHLMGVALPSVLMSEHTQMATIMRLANLVRASMTIRIQVNTTKFHAGRLVAYFVPTGARAAITMVSEALQYPNVILDAAISNVGELHVPYIAPYESQMTAVSSFPEVGRLMIIDATGLASVSNSDPEVKGLVWVKFNLETAAIPGPLKGLFSMDHDALFPRSYAAYPHAGIGQADHSDGKTLVQKATNAPNIVSGGTLRGNMFGEDHMNIHTLVTKPHLMYESWTNTPKHVSFAFPVTPRNMVPTRTVGPIMDYFGEMFLTWSGAMRYQLITNATAACDRVVLARFIASEKFARESTYAYNYVVNGMVCPGDATNLRTMPCLEYEIPWYSMFSQLYVQDSNSDNPGWPKFVTSPGQFEISLTGSLDPDIKTAQDVTLRLYKSAGDDFRFRYAICPPPVPVQNQDATMFVDEKQFNRAYTGLTSTVAPLPASHNYQAMPQYMGGAAAMVSAALLCAGYAPVTGAAFGLVCAAYCCGEKLDQLTGNARVPVYNVIKRIPYELASAVSGQCRRAVDSGINGFLGGYGNSFGDGFRHALVEPLAKLGIPAPFEAAARVARLLFEAVEMSGNFSLAKAMVWMTRVAEDLCRIFDCGMRAFGDHLTSAANWLMDFMGVVRPQLETVPAIVIGLLTAMVGLLFSTARVPWTAASSVAEKIVHKLCATGRAMKDINSLATSLPTLFTTIVDGLLAALGVVEEKRFLGNMSIDEPEMEQWARAVIELSTMVAEEELRVNMELRDAITILHKEGQKYFIKFNASGKTSAPFMSIWTRIVKLKDACDKAGKYVGVGKRVSPYHVMLCGAPGTSKTYRMRELGKHLLKTTHGIAEDAHCYTFNPGDQYFSGYDAQPIFLADDVGFYRTENDANSFFGIMPNLFSNEHYPLNMADLSEKGKAFRSVIAVTTTNDAHYIPREIPESSRDGVRRRRHVLARLSTTILAHPEDRGRTGNLKRAGAEYLTMLTPYVLEHYTSEEIDAGTFVQELDPMEVADRIVGEPITWMAFKERTALRYKTHYEREYLHVYGRKCETIYEQIRMKYAQDKTEAAAMWHFKCPGFSEVYKALKKHLGGREMDAFWALVGTGAQAQMMRGSAVTASTSQPSCSVVETEAGGFPDLIGVPESAPEDPETGRPYAPRAEPLCEDHLLHMIGTALIPERLRDWFPGVTEPCSARSKRLRVVRGVWHFNCLTPSPTAQTAFGERLREELRTGSSDLDQELDFWKIDLATYTQIVESISKRFQKPCRREMEEIFRRYDLDEYLTPFQSSLLASALRSITDRNITIQEYLSELDASTNVALDDFIAWLKGVKHEIVRDGVSRWHVLGMIGVVLAAIPLGMFGVRLFGKREDPEAQGGHSEAYDKDPRRRKSQRPYKFASRAQNGEEAGFDELEAPQVASAKQDVMDKIADNFVWIEGESHGKPVATPALVVCGTIALLPYHTMRALDPSKPVRVSFYTSRGDVTQTSPVNVKRIKRMRMSGKDKDVVLWDFDGVFPARKDITKHFISRDASRSEDTYPARLVFRAIDSALLSAREVLATPLDCPVTYKTDGNFDGPEEELVVTHGWMYDTPSRVGMCGTMLLYEEKNGYKLMGMHCAGTPSYGFSEHLDREMISDHLHDMEWVDAEDDIWYDVRPMEDPECDPKIVLQGEIENLGQIRGRAPFMAAATALVKSPEFEVILPNDVGPAAFSSSDPRVKVKGSIVRRCAEGFGRPAIPFETRDIEAVQEHLLATVMKFRPPDPRRLTTVEAINGSTRTQYHKPLDLTTSTGWPYVSDKKYAADPGKYKLELLENPNSAFWKDFVKFEAACRAGKRSNTFWMDKLKDEKRKLTKIEQGRTRAFNVGPLPHVILTRMMTMDFSAACYANHGKFFSMVGVCPESFEWEKLYNQLVEFSPEGIDADYSEFDRMVHPTMIRAFAGIVIAWYGYTGDDARCVRTLLDEVCHTNVIALDLVYRKIQGNPSGFAMTALLNCFVNAMYIRMAWRVVRRRSGLSDHLSYFDKEYLDRNYGDDLLIAVKPGATVRPSEIQDVLAAHNLTMTEANKLSPRVNTRPIRELTFLKRAFVEWDGHIMAQIEVATIAGICNWIRKDSHDTPHESMTQNLFVAMCFASFHGQELYGAILEVAKEKKYRLPHMYAHARSMRDAIMHGSISVTVDGLDMDIGRDVIGARVRVPEVMAHMLPMNPAGISKLLQDTGFGNPSAEGSVAGLGTRVLTKGIKALENMLGDSPTIPPQGNHQNTHESLSQASIPRSARRLALCPLATRPEADSQETADEMDLRKLLGTKNNLVHRIDLALDTYVSIPITPLLSEVDSTYAGHRGSTLAYVSRIFSFWRGSLVFRLDFVCNQFATGRYTATWIPYASDPPKFTDEILQSYPTIVMDLHEARSWDFTVPYISNTRAKRVGPRYIEDGAMSLSERTCNGQLVIRSLTPLISPNETVASSLKQLWIWLRAGDDFELAVPHQLEMHALVNPTEWKSPIPTTTPAPRAADLRPVGGSRSSPIVTTMNPGPIRTNVYPGITDIPVEVTGKP